MHSRVVVCRARVRERLSKTGIRMPLNVGRKKSTLRLRSCVCLSLRGVFEARADRQERCVHATDPYLGLAVYGVSPRGVGIAYPPAASDKIQCQE